MHGGFAHFVQVEAADVGGHGNADALVRRHQDVGERGGQQARLLHGAVVAVHEVDRILVDVLEDLGANGGKLGLGVTRGGVAQVAGVVLAEVALGFHEGREQGLVARGKAHHGLVDGRIAMGVQLHGLADDVGALLARAVEQAHLVHGIQKLAVRRLEPVDLRERAGHVGAQWRRACSSLRGFGVMGCSNTSECKPITLGLSTCFFFGCALVFLATVSLDANGRHRLARARQFRSSAALRKALIAGQAGRDILCHARRCDACGPRHRCPTAG